MKSCETCKKLEAENASLKDLLECYEIGEQSEGKALAENVKLKAELSELREDMAARIAGLEKELAASKDSIKFWREEAKRYAGLADKKNAQLSELREAADELVEAFHGDVLQTSWMRQDNALKDIRALLKEDK